MLDIKIKVSDVAKELGVTSKEVVAKASEIGIAVKAANSSMSEKEAENLAQYISTGVYKSETKKEVVAEIEATKPEVKVVHKTKDIEVAVETKEVGAKDKVLKVTKRPKRKLEIISSKRVVVEPVKEIVEEVRTPEVVAPKEVIVKDETIVEEVKVPEVVIPKEPLVTETPKIEKLSTNIVSKRRKLHIVKKKRKVEVIERNVAPRFSQFDDLLSVNNDNSISSKKKKIKKAITTSSSKSNNSMRINLDRELSDISMDFNNEIQLDTFDLINEEISREEEAKKKEAEQKKKKPDNQQQRKKRQRKKQTISRKLKKRKVKKVESDEIITEATIPEEVRVYEFAEAIGRTISEVISVLFKLGLMVTKNDFLDKDSIEILAEEFEIDVIVKDVFEELDYEKDYEEEVLEKGSLETRPPVVTIMGHVDHGKTSLLDKIRATKVADKEHGGITQHIGAYSVSKNGKDISFLDTPGHEAFSAMRARGAMATDIIVIVVAADDGVKPQTKESIEHAQQGKIPFIIAINKMDKEGANPEHAKAQLAELNVVPVEWGGDIEFVEISAHTGAGIDDLLETILLQAEVLELEASPSSKFKAIVVESSVEKGLGPVATVIVQNGTLTVGSIVVCGVAYGKVRAIKNEHSKNLKSILPGFPAVITGLSEVPNAGDILVEVDTDKIAREFAGKKADYLRQKELSKSTKVTLDDLSSKIAEGQIKSLPVILKADVYGSLEALQSSLEKIKNDEVKVNVIHASVGGITQTDLALAEASENAVIVGFQVRPTGSIKQNAKSKGISITTYNIIYELIDDIKALVSGLMSPVEREEHLGQAEVRETFKVPKLGLVAGCMVTDGLMKRGAKIRVIREGVVIYEGEVSTLKRFKDDAKEVKKGFECGLGVVGYTDVKVGDFLESYTMVKEEVSLTFGE